MEKQREDEQIEARYGVPAETSPQPPIPAYPAKETIAPTLPMPTHPRTTQRIGHDESRVHLQERPHPQGTHEVTPEYTRSEYARSVYPVYVPEPADSRPTGHDFFAAHTTEPITAGEETQWAAPHEVHQPFPSARKISEAHKPAAPPRDPNLPWWLSEAPLTTAELADREAQERAAQQKQRAARPASDEPVRLPASRLSGLRNVIFGTGSRGPSKRETEKQEIENRHEVVFDRQAESPVAPALNEIRQAREIEQLYQAATPLPEPPAPAVNGYEPLSYRVEPVARVLEPAAPIAEPPAFVAEPAAPLVEPVIHVVEPAAPVFEPVVPAVEPAASVVAPAAHVVEFAVPLAEFTAPLFTAPLVQPASIFEPVHLPRYDRVLEAARSEADPEQTVVAHEAPQTFALPEILPPQPIAAPRHRRDAWGGEPKQQLDRGDANDDIPLLPSRRGQYRRKG